MPLAFLLDEHLRGPLWDAIQRHNVQSENRLDVVRVGDPADLPLAADDSQILAWAERERRILVTEDRHTMIDHLQNHIASGQHSPGVLLVRAGVRISELLECLELAAYAGEAAEFADTVTFVP